MNSDTTEDGRLTAMPDQGGVRRFRAEQVHARTAVHST
jgi:hypothetical protein